MTGIIKTKFNSGNRGWDGEGGDVIKAEHERSSKALTKFYFLT